MGLEAPLSWLARALYDQDVARLERLWQTAPGSLKLIGEATRGFIRRYPTPRPARPSARA